jgi:hypothetical protein
VDDLLQWFEEEDGFFNSKQEILPEIPGDPTSRLGIFAKERIEEGEMLAQIPWDIIITNREEQEEDDDDGNDKEHLSRISCSIVRNLVREIKLGKESEYAPYVSYLLAQKQGQLPSSWSEAGKKLFVEVLGGERNLEILMNDSVDLLDHDWFELCGGEKSDDLSRNAAMLVQQYSKKDRMMIPIFDFYTHRNGSWYNIKTILSKEGYTVVARRTIEAGEPIHNSIDQCDDCHGFDEFDGTPGKFETQMFQ